MSTWLNQNVEDVPEELRFISGQAAHAFGVETAKQFRHWADLVEQHIAALARLQAERDAALAESRRQGAHRDAAKAEAEALREALRVISLTTENRGTTMKRIARAALSGEAHE